MIRQALCRQLAFTQHVIQRNLAGMTHEQSLGRPTGGSSANWVLGHIVSSRSTIHRLLGLPPALTEADAAPYARGGTPPEAARAVPTERLLAALGRSQEALLAAIGAVDDARLAEDAGAPPGTPIAGLDRGQAIAALVFHEAYHAGQLGVLRRASGLGGAIA